VTAVPATLAPAEDPESESPTVTPTDVPEVEPPTVVLEPELWFELVTPTEDPSGAVTPTEVLVSVPEVDVDTPTDAPPALAPMVAPVLVPALPPMPPSGPELPGAEGPLGTSPVPPGALAGSPDVGSMG